MPKEVITQWDVNVGYEDLPIAVSDYDYNDWLTGMDGELTYCSIGGEIKGLDHIEFLINPQSRGAAYDHIFHIRFAANTFLSDGTYTLNLYDKNGIAIGAPRRHLLHLR